MPEPIIFDKDSQNLKESRAAFDLHPPIGYDEFKNHMLEKVTET